MPRTRALLAALFVVAAVPALAEYSVSLHGDWPKSWPKQLEPLRNQSSTFVGPMAEFRQFVIHFNSREQFEAAWPHILKVKAKGAPIFLLRAPNFFLGDQSKAGVIVHCPPLPREGSRLYPEAPIAGVVSPAERWMNATYIELVVDDNVVDLHRIKLPKGVEVVDKRGK